MKNSIAFTFVLMSLFIMPAIGHSYSRLTTAACPDGWAQPSDQDLYANTSNASGLAEAFQIMAAMQEVADRVDTVGGQSFDFNDPYLIETATYAYDGSGPNDNSENEVGLADLSSLSSSGNVLGLGPTLVDGTTCTAIESDVYLDVNDTWDWGVPENGRPTDTCESEDCYFDASNKYCTDGSKVENCPSGPWIYWARPTLLHEIGHTLGLAHSDHSYSFMNYELRPWTNRSDKKRIEFLPDDREALREIYPGSADEIDAAVTMTWFDSGDVSSSGAARAKQLCRPSKGDGYSSSIFDETCGVDADGSDGETEVCPGDTLYVRYAIANYGTESLVVDEQLWFSKNTNLNRTAGADYKANNDKADLTMSPQSSYRRGKTYTVPFGVDLGSSYYPIIFVDSGADLTAEESQQNNWIPLRSKVQVKTFMECFAKTVGPGFAF